MYGEHLLVRMKWYLDLIQATLTETLRYEAQTGCRQWSPDSVLSRCTQ